jgi:hypothetical protein
VLYPPVIVESYLDRDMLSDCLFLIICICISSKENKRTDIQIQTRIRIRIQLSQPNFSKDPKKKKNYNINPRSFMKLPKSTTSSPDIAAEEEDGHCRALETPLRQLALSGVKIDTRQQERDGANGGTATTGAAPRHPQHPNPSSPTTTTVTAERPSQIRPTSVHNTQQQHRIQAKEKGGQQTHQPRPLEKGMCRIPFSSALPMALEGVAKGARKRPREFILPRRQRQRQRHAVVAEKT